MRRDAYIDKVIRMSERLNDQALTDRLLKAVMQGQSLDASIKIGERLMLANRWAPAKIMVEALIARGEEHPLLDEFKAKVMWAVGDRDKAIRFLEERNKVWKRPYLKELLEIFYCLKTSPE